MKNRVAILPALAIAVGVAVFVLGIFPKKSRPRPYVFPESARWVTAPGEAQTRGYFRLDFNLPAGEIARAWVTVAADTGFEIIANKNPSGRWNFYRSTRPFQSGHSEYGQRLRTSPPAIALNFPREYQWSDNANWRLPIFLDLTPSLVAGSVNTLAVTTEARHGKPSFILTGEVTMATGETIALASSESWKAAAHPGELGQRAWADGEHSIEHWAQAQTAERQRRHVYRLAPEKAFSEPFIGRWMVAPADRRSTVTTTWNLGQKAPDEAWLRIAASAPYLLRINGQTVRPKSGPTHHPAKGEWIVQPASRRVLAVAPALLDPDEAAGIYGGAGFLNPRHGDPTQNDFSTEQFSADLSQDSHGDITRGDLLRRSQEDRPQRARDEIGDKEGFSGTTPAAAARPVSDLDFSCLDVSQFVHAGANEIEFITLPEQASPYRAARENRFAIDAAADGFLGLGKTQIWMRDGQQIPLGREAKPTARLRFFQSNGGGAPVLPTLLITFPLALIVLSCLQVKGSEFRRPSLLFIVVVSLAALLWAAMAEKSEELWFAANPWWWLVVLLIASGSAAALSIYRPVQQQTRGRSRDRAKRIVHTLLFVTLVLGFALRAYSLDLQPLDDDEYASVQAALSIADHGTPELSPGIFYTRSPAYHYLAGLSAKIFGSHLWALRLPSILAGVATIFLVYLLGSRVLRSRNMGLAAAVLLAVHPFCIFTAHIARFYQQQQLFTVATVLFFVWGFVQRGPTWMRGAAIVCYGLTVLSQEISLILCVPFAFCYALTARPAGLRKEFRLASTTALVMGAIVLNLVVFKVKCLTRLEGISPNAEATLKPHFWEPLNLFSMWIGYARIHVVLGVLSLIGMFAAFKKRAGGMIAITFFLLFGVIGTVVLVSSQGFRYQYALLPLWLLTGVYGVRVVARAVATRRNKKVYHGVVFAVVAVVFLSFAPWRIPGSYKLRLLPDSSGAASFVRTNLRAGDKVAITEPHPHAALLEIGQADYDLVVPVLYDFVYRSEDGRLIDRNGGAEVIGRLGVLQREIAKHDRVWFLINREKLRNRARNFRWEYAGARVDYFIRQNCELQYQGYLWDVYLWDRSKGSYQLFRQEPMAWNE